MLKKYHQLVGGTLRILDACVIGGLWLLSFWLRFTLQIIPVTKGFPAFETYAALTPLVVFLWAIVFSAMGIYRSHEMHKPARESFEVWKAHGIALLIFIALTYLFSEYRYSRGVMLYFSVLGAITLVVQRLVIRHFLRRLREKGQNLRRFLIVGQGPLLQVVRDKQELFPELGIEIIGTLVKDKNETQGTEGIKILGRFEDLSSVIEREKPDELLLVLRRSESASLDSILSQIKDGTIEIRLAPDVHDYVALGCQVENFDGHPILNINESPLDGWGAIVKRVTDFALSFAFLALFSPLFLLIAALTKLTSRGPIFYRQERMGLDGRTFDMIKFRSMRVDSESKTGAVWATKDDNRTTAWGKFMRRTSLDELPQFWNVLKGEMSLVGPRPERPVFVSQFRGEIPNYMLRHKVKSGITGWAQINGWRGNTSLKKRIEFDLFYIQHWSYFWDLKILLMTLWRGFINKNAY